MKKVISLLVLVAVLGGGGYAYWHTQNGSKTVLKFDESKRGHLVATISATGTLQPREVVDVGAQVQGPILAIGKDTSTQSGIVDWGSVVEGPTLDSQGNVVKKGTVLAQIDDAIYRAQFNSAQAAVKSAQASYESAKSDLDQKTALKNQSQRDWDRAENLTHGGIQQQEYDTYKANYEVAQANVKVSRAQIDVAEAQIGVAQSNMKTAQTNLNYTTITSPVNGVVIDRRVNVGQTVVASLSAPSLFLIAKDLSQMEVWATVNEVDVGKIKVGQDVKFTVDAYPGQQYWGKVVPQGKLAKRLNATMNQNVVTYTVVVSVDNTERKLDPYLTANLSFIISDKHDALMVPNAALRWTPSPKQIVPDQRDAYNKLKSKKRLPSDSEAQDRGFIWVATEDGFVRYSEVRIGVSDSLNTEILGFISGDLPEHTRVVVGEGKAEAAGGTNANPFAPQMFKGNKPKEKDKE